MTATETAAATGSKSWIAALLLCFFVGTFGIHRFYVGKIGTGILMLVTFGGFGLWTLIDFIMIAIGKFSDKQGNALAR
jgi:TM2 domain-containing membrane protein YozV